MIKKTLPFFFLVWIVVTQSCISPIGKEFTKLPPGTWRATLFLNESSMVQPANKKDVERRGYIDGELPFNFEVIYDDSEKFHINFLNAEEKITVKDIYYGRDKATAKDTLKIVFNEFDSYIYAIYEEGIMEGYWQVNYRENYRIKFKAMHGEDYRFSFISRDTSRNFNGRWSAIFSEGTEEEYPAVADFTQTGNQLTGTILTETGDYRYLQGNVAGNKAWLSCFDGAHAFLIEAKLDEKDKIIGLFRSGTHHQEPWSAQRNAKASLKAADALTQVQKGHEKFVINLPNESGSIINSSEGKYKDKIKIIEVMGTWCPNCKDATIYLKDLKGRMPELEIIALAYERYRDKSKSMQQLQKYKQENALPFEMVLGGYYDKKEALATLPQIDKLMSYPTILIVDKNDYIVKVFTGFYGPATKEHKDFVASIESAIKQI